MISSRLACDVWSTVYVCVARFNILRCQEFLILGVRDLAISLKMANENFSQHDDDGDTHLGRLFVEVPYYCCCRCYCCVGYYACWLQHSSA